MTDPLTLTFMLEHFLLGTYEFVKELLRISRHRRNTHPALRHGHPTGKPFKLRTVF